MSLDRYLRDDEGFRKYVELIECMPLGKRQKFLEAAKPENPMFVAEAQKYIFTFERITRLPSLELTEVLGAIGLKPETIATAVASIEDESIKEMMLKHIPRNLLASVVQQLKEYPVPQPYDVGSARLQLIKKARELEKIGRLESMQIPHFSRDHFHKKSA